MTADFEDSLANLIGRIYDAALDPPRWKTLIQDIAAFTGGYGGSLALWNTQQGQLLFSYNQAYDDGVWQEYGTHLIHDDPYAHALVARPDLEIYSGEMLIDADVETHNDVRKYVRSYTDQRHAYGARIFANDEFASMLILARSGAQGPASATELARLRMLLPHLRRSLLIGRRLGNEISESALNAMSFGVLVLDTKGGVTLANHALREIAAEADGIALTGAGLKLFNPNDDIAYRRQLDAVLRLSFLTGTPDRVALRAQRISGKRAYAIVITPFPLREAVYPDPHPAALVCIADPVRQNALSEQLLTSLYSLTEAQAALATALVRHGNLRAAAAVCGVTEGSARQYLKRIFEKTGVRSQVELVSLLNKAMLL